MQVQTNVDVSQLKLDSSKPTILVVSDSAAIHSGFGQVVRNLFKRIHRLKEWNIVQFGWWHQAPMERVPWPIVTTDRNPDNPALVSLADKYGEISFARVVGAINPNLVWTMGDPWMVSPVLNKDMRGRWPTIYYVPVDGAPTKYSWDVVEMADIVVPYLPWGKKVLERWWPKANIVEPIPHGVDTTVYKPLFLDDRNKARMKDFGLGPEDFIMMTVSRNQGRKNLPALIEITKYIRSGDYRVCTHCGRAYRNPFDYHLGRPTGDVAICERAECIAKVTIATSNGNLSALNYMEDGEPNPNFYYYMHTPINDLEGASYRLLDILSCLGCGVQDGDAVRYPGFRWNESLKSVHGMKEEDLVRLYAAADLFCLPATGEGFGLPILESMACGTPVVVSNVSSHPDFAKAGGRLVDIAYHVCEPVSGYYRGYVDLDDLLTNVLYYVNNRAARDADGVKAREAALNYNWDDIALQWREVIRKGLKSRPSVESWRQFTTI